MAASAVYILDLKGKVLISRNYRGDLPLNTIEKFPKILMEAEEEGTMTPVMTDDGVTFIHIKCNNIYVVCTTTGRKKGKSFDGVTFDLQGIPMSCALFRLCISCVKSLQNILKKSKKNLLGIILLLFMSS